MSTKLNPAENGDRGGRHLFMFGAGSLTFDGMAEPRQIIVRAPAKLNLALSVGAPDADRMHPIASWMVTTDFADDLHLRRLDEGRDSLYAIIWAPDAPRTSLIDWPIQTDLAVRAHLELEHSDFVLLLSEHGFALFKDCRGGGCALVH